MGRLNSFFRNDILDARDPLPDPGIDSRPAVFAHGQGPTGEEFTEPPAIWRSDRLPLKKDKTFMFMAYEGLLQDEQTALPLLANSSIFVPKAASKRFSAALAALPGEPVRALPEQWI